MVLVDLTERASHSLLEPDPVLYYNPAHLESQTIFSPVRDEYRLVVSRYINRFSAERSYDPHLQRGGTHALISESACVDQRV